MTVPKGETVSDWPSVYPPTPRVPEKRIRGGVAYTDPFGWLERDSADTREWTSRQDDLANRTLGSLQGQAWFADRLRLYSLGGTVTVPQRRGTASYFLRRRTRDEHPRIVVRDEISGSESECVLPHRLGAGEGLGQWAPSPDRSLLAVQVIHGSEEAELYVHRLDVDTGAVGEAVTVIARSGNTALHWLPGARSRLLYVQRLDPEGLPADERAHHRRVRMISMDATGVTSDVEVFGSGRSPFDYYTFTPLASLDATAIVTHSPNTAENEVWILPDGEPRPTRLITPPGRAAVRDRAGRLLLLTEAAAPRRTVLQAASPGLMPDPAWETLVSEREDASIEDVRSLEDGHLLIHRVRHAVAELTVLEPWSESSETPIPLPGLGTVSSLSPSGNVVDFLYTDFTSPARVLTWTPLGAAHPIVSVASDEPPLPSIEVEHLSCSSDDGTIVRMFLLRPSGEAQPRPTIVYAYGGFGVSLTPVIAPNNLAWVEAGGHYVIVNVRGGGEEGRAWHSIATGAGKRLAVQDLAAAGHYLVDEGWTQRGSLGVHGSSNGGLLAAAASVECPGLFEALICSAPLLDLMEYDRFGLGRLWHSEYGDPDDPELAPALLDFSPYHTILSRPPATYPATLLTVFAEDTRVHAMHARKGCAALQARGKSDRPVLLRLEPDIGHGGQRSVSTTVDYLAATMSFMAWRLGLAVNDAPEGRDAVGE